MSTVWTKYIIPIPNASKLKIEKGMFFFSEGPENGDGYSFWMDEVKFEKLGTIAHGQVAIYNGTNKTETSFNGIQSSVSGLTATFNLPNGIDQTVVTPLAYLDFTSSHPDVATVNEVGVINTLTSGSTVITATLGGQPVLGSLTLNSFGTYTHATPPTRNADKVISIFSETYPNVPVDYYNGYYAPYQTTQSADFTIANDNVLNYTNFNFVGIQFSAPTIDASSMSHLHVDLYLPNAVAAGSTFKIEVSDLGRRCCFWRRQ